MPDRRRHRGAHPGDAERFGEERIAILRLATADLSWLLGRGYARDSALRLVGDRFQLDVRERLAVKRCACSAEQAHARRAKEVAPRSLEGATVWIDGFNVLTTVEAALSGGPLLVGRDGALRDMASMHGSYRRVEETGPSLEAIADELERRGPRRCRWLLDAPVSNSGRLRGLIEALGKRRGLAWRVDVVPDPDPILREAGDDVVVASADSGVLDDAKRSWPLARDVVAGLPGEVWRVDLTDHPVEVDAL